MNYLSSEKSDVHNTRLAMVAKYTHNAIVITDPNGLVEWVNDGFTRITGYVLEDLIGKKPGSLLQGPQSDQRTISIVREAIKNEKPFDVELINYTKDGYPYWIRIEGVPLRDEDGTLNGFMAIESDISNRKQYEDMLVKARQAAEAANDAKTQFLDNISHELRTPMNGIIGLTTLLDDTSLNDEQNAYVQDILSSSERLLSLIENLFTFSDKRLKDSMSILHPVDLEKLLENLVDNFTRKADEKDVGLKYSFGKSMPKYIFGNESLIRQVIFNLCDNAIKFTQKGNIQISMELSGPALDRYIIVTVTDTGIGFDTQQLKELFQPFNQTDSSLTRSYEGAGIGLYASRRIAKMIEGDIELSSTKGQGTSAKFWWPI